MILIDWTHSLIYGVNSHLIPWMNVVAINMVTSIIHRIHPKLALVFVTIITHVETRNGGQSWWMHQWYATPTFQQIHNSTGTNGDARKLDILLKLDFQIRVNIIGQIFLDS